MARKLGTKILRLIRERSSLQGELPSLEKVVAERESELQVAREKLERITSRLAEVDRTIVAMAPSIDPTEIRAQKRKPRRHSAANGALIRTAVEVLQDAGPLGMTSKELSAQLLLLYPMDLSTPANRRAARERQRSLAAVLRRRGAIEKVGTEVDPVTGQKIIRWRWVEV